MKESKGRNGGTLYSKEPGDKAFPNSGRPPKTDIIKLMAEMLDGDGYTIVEGTLLDDDGNSTGQKVKIRASVPNMQAAARAFMQNLKKGDTKTLQIFLDRTLGKVPQDFTSGGEKIGSGPMDNLPLAKRLEILNILDSDKYNESGHNNDQD